MLQHSTADFYDLSATTSLSNRQTPPYSPCSSGGVSVSAISANNNNNNINANNNNNLDVLGQNGGSSSNSAREPLPSFTFTQEQVACVCEVSNDTFYFLLKLFQHPISNCR